MQNKLNPFIKIIGSICLVIVLQSCKTDDTEGPRARPEWESGEQSHKSPRQSHRFQNLVLLHVTLNPAFVSKASNQKAKEMIDNSLFFCMRQKFPNLTESRGDDRSPVVPGTLRIEPTIEKIQWISGKDRLIKGRLAGNSTVTVKVRYIDTETGRIVAEPDFYKTSDATDGAWSVGTTDKAMLDEIAAEICKFTEGVYK